MSEARNRKISWRTKIFTVGLSVVPLATITMNVIRASSISNQKRGIASINEESAPSPFDVAGMDLSGLSAADLKKTFKYQLLREVRATHFEDSINISLGLFLVRNSTGGSVTVCDRYTQIEVTLKSGDAEKILQSPCHVSDDQNHIEATSIDFDSKGKSAWKITGVRLLSDKPDDSLEVSPQDLRAVLGQEIAIEEVH